MVTISLTASKLERKWKHNLGVCDGISRAVSVTFGPNDQSQPALY